MPYIYKYDFDSKKITIDKLDWKQDGDGKFVIIDWYDSYDCSTIQEYDIPDNGFSEVNEFIGIDDYMYAISRRMLSIEKFKDILIEFSQKEVDGLEDEISDLFYQKEKFERILKNS